MKGRLAVALLTATLALAGCNHANRPVPLPGQEALVSQLLYGCPYGLERFLPGDYYYCQGGSHYFAARFGMARDSMTSAARWASKPAQYALGIMYFNGDHIAANRPLGVAWMALAAERHGVEYEATFVSAYRELSPEERAQADAYWREMKPVYGDAFAAKRANTRFNREYFALEDAVMMGGGAYINGLTPTTVPGMTILKRIKNERDTFFAGWDAQVWVGDAELVPLSQLPGINTPTKKLP